MIQRFTRSNNVTQTNEQYVYQQNGYAFFFHIYLVHIVPTVLKTHLPVFDSMYGSYFLSSRLNVLNKSFTYIKKFIDLPTIILLFMIFQFYYESYKKHFYKAELVLSVVRLI